MPPQPYNFRKCSVVTSLCFCTNIATYGPYGSDKFGHYFSCGENGAIVGFHGIADDDFIVAIGAYIMPEHVIPHEEHLKRRKDEDISSKGCIKFGPSGGSRGGKWIHKPEGLIIRKIIIRHGDAIGSIQFKSNNGDGVPQYYNTIGRGGEQFEKIHTHTIIIDYPREYLTSISGSTGTISRTSYSLFEKSIKKSYLVVTSLCLYTNKAKYGPYGDHCSNENFSYGGKGGAIVGFHGHADEYVEAIGIYAVPESVITDRIKLEDCSTHNKRPKTCELTSQVVNDMKAVVLRDPGPWGSSDGKVWDDGVFSEIKQILVHLDENANLFHAIQFEYLKRDGCYVWSPLYGGIKDGGSIKRVNLEGKVEFVVGISGFYGEIEGEDKAKAIRSITIHTNKGKYGPFGCEMGAQYTYFASSTSTGKVVGFHGRSDDYLKAIGVHMDYF